MNNTQFADRMIRITTAVAEEWPINPIIAASQAILESGYGKSLLARKANNLFGIKAGKTWKGLRYTIKTREWDPDKGTYVILADFRAYPNWDECMADYGSIISRLSWYKDAVEGKDDPYRYLDGILPTAREPGWATDPHYRQKIITIAKRHGWL